MSSTTDSSRVEAIIFDLLRIPPRFGRFDGTAVAWRPLPIPKVPEWLLASLRRPIEQSMGRARGIVCVFRPSSFSETRTAAVIASVLGFARSVPAASLSVAEGEVSPKAIRQAIRRFRLKERFFPAYSGKPNIGPPKRTKGAVRFHRTAGAIILDSRRRVLLISLSWGPGWTIPHGHIDRGESALTAARREAREETGLGDLRFIRQLPETRYRFNENGRAVEHREARFLFRYSGGRTTTRSPEGRTLRWVPIPQAIRTVRYRNIRVHLRDLPKR